MSLIPERGYGMLGELIECFLARTFFRMEDCAFDKMTFFYRKHLLSSECCFLARRIPQNPIVLFFGQKSKSFGVLAKDFKNSTEKKDKFLFSKTKRPKHFSFFFLILFKN